MGASKRVVKDETNKAVAFVNWQVGNVKSQKGFRIFDNEYTTRAEQALVELAKKHGGSVKVKAELHIVVANEEVEDYDLDSIEVIID